MIYDVVIIGGGPAGYTAALYCVRSGLSVLVLEKLSPGGQMAATSVIDNYPGFEEGIEGFDLGQKMKASADRFGAKTLLGEVFSLDLQSDIKKIESSEGGFEAKTVIIATGAAPRKLGLPEEDALAGRGVAYCATCDGMFFKGKTVAVIGGGNSAVEDTQSGKTSDIACEGVFVAVGRIPNTAFIKDVLATDKNGYIIADETTQTSIPGVFAAGDVRTKPLRQIVNACADGACASKFAEEYINVLP